MPSLIDLAHHGAASAWLFIPSAILLGALHGLEPGHSKTMMAAFIIAVRGTVGQAVLLGLAATFSHTLIVWVVALTGMHFGGHWNEATTEPYLQVASAVLIIGVALWMLWRTWSEQQRIKHEHNDHDHADHHHHGQEIRRIDTGHGVLALEIFEDGVPPRWRLRTESGQPWSARSVAVETSRPDGQRQTFAFADRHGCLESIEEIPEPHAFTARLKLFHGDHAHDYDVEFQEHDHEHDHGHDHEHGHVSGLNVIDGGQHDAHEMAHANDIRRRFASGNVTTGQIVMFGLTGGLIPCPAAITVLVLCLQLKRFALGVVLVLAFSTGLAVTMVMAGVVASLSMRQVSRRWSGFDTFARRTPYFSSAVIIGVGLFVGVQGLATLSAGG